MKRLILVVLLLILVSCTNTWKAEDKKNTLDTGNEVKLNQKFQLVEGQTATLKEKKH